MWVDASDATFLNLGVTLLSLCEGFIDPSSASALRIDTSYLRSETSLFPADETLLCASGEEDETKEGVAAASAPASGADGALAWAGDTALPTEVAKDPVDYHFITRVFFLCLRALHVGLLPVRGGGGSAIVLRLCAQRDVAVTSPCRAHR